MRAIALLAVLAGIVFDAGCVQNATQVIVAINTDAPLARQLTVRVAVHSGGTLASDGSTATWVRGGPLGTPVFPGTFGIAPSAGQSQTGPAMLVLEAQLAAGSAGEPAVSFRRIARFSFTQHTTTSLPIFLAVSCGNFTTGCQQTDPTMCTVSALCEEQGRTCGNDGRCVTADVTPVALDRDADPLALVQPDVMDVTSGDPALDAIDATDAPSANDLLEVNDATDVSDAPLDAPSDGCTGTVCAGACVDTSVDRTNCGRCGMTCTGPCSNGACARVLHVVAGGDRSCAVLTDGRVRCWGDNTSGLLGTGATGDASRPTTILAGIALVDVSLGTDNTCARSASAVTCWGVNGFGQCGDGTSNPRAASAGPVSALAGYIDVRVGEYASCGRQADTSVWCWGANGFGQIGDGTNNDAPAPVQAMTAPPGPQPVPATQFGIGNDHECALLVDHTVVCWGDNQYGQLGRTTRTTCSDTTTNTPCGLNPAPVMALGNVVQLAVAGDYNCARTMDGTVSCWGINDLRQLGNGTAPYSMTPLLVLANPAGAPLSTVTDIAVGPHHAMAHLADGSVWAWGDNRYGQLADGTTMSPRAPEHTVVAGALEIALGDWHSCFRLTDGTASCVGKGDRGQIGDGTLAPMRATPTAVLW